MRLVLCLMECSSSRVASSAPSQRRAGSQQGAGDERGECVELRGGGAGGDERGGEFPRLGVAVALQPGGDFVLAIALREGIERRLVQGAVDRFARGAGELRPLRGIDVRVELAGGVLHGLDALAQRGGGAARGGGGVVQLVGEAGGHGAELGELFALLAPAFEIADARGEHAQNLHGDRLRGAQQLVKAGARQAKEPARPERADGRHVGRHPA